MMEAQKLTNIWQPFNGEYNVFGLGEVAEPEAK